MNYGDVVGILATGGLLLVCSHAFDFVDRISKTNPWSGTYFHTLEISAQALEMDLPNLGELVRPDRGLPGLC